MSNTLTSKVSGRMSSRGWAIALGIGAVVLAAILLVVYLDRYRARVGGENAPTPVLRREAGSSRPGRRVRSSRASPCTRRRRSRRRKSRSGRSPIPRTSAVARRPPDIFPGAQLTATDFAASDTASVDSQITGTQRAISISIDNVHGVALAGAGRRLGRRLHVRRRRRQALPPERQGARRSRRSRARAVAATSSSGSRPEDAATWAYAADNTQFYFVLRPVVGAKPTKPSQANASTVLR